MNGLPQTAMAEKKASGSSFYLAMRSMPKAEDRKSTRLNSSH